MDNHTNLPALKVVLAAGTAHLAVEAGVEDFTDSQESVKAHHPVLVAAAAGGIAAVEGDQSGSHAAVQIRLLAAVFDPRLGNQT